MRMNKMEQYKSEMLIAEIGKPMYDGLLELKSRLKKFGWTDLKPCREFTNAERIVVEAKDSSGHTHWFQISRNGEFSPCVAYMRCR